MPDKAHSSGGPLLRDLLSKPVLREAIRSKDEFKVDDNLPDGFKELLRRLSEKERADK